MRLEAQLRWKFQEGLTQPSSSWCWLLAGAPQLPATQPLILELALHGDLGAACQEGEA